ncbi:MAG TPA: protein kinase, partial [Gemmatimonadaceae bacterium]|nr:protein kinase [Gemmatimonadaceae bacterium]
NTELRQQLQAVIGDEFLIERELGGGGMSAVFLAEERRLGRRVVIKVLSPDVSGGLSMERFEREIAFAARLSDPRIVPLLRTGHVDDLPYYTMPFVEGESLRARMARGPIPVDEAVSILRDVALALEYAHARQVVHRDIKPENILLAGRTAVVTDFGIAKAITAATMPMQHQTLTSVGTIIGTPAYMAPEQAAGEVVDARADLYSWGMIAYEMLSGGHPFSGHTTVQALLAAQITESPRPLAEVRPDLPAQLSALVDQCLAKAVDQRPASASEIVERLGHATSPPASAGAQAVRRPLVVSVTAAMLVLLTGGGWFYQHERHAQWAHGEAVSQAAGLVEHDRALAAYQVLQRAQSYAPDDPKVAAALAANSDTMTILSTPAGATVAIQDYVSPDSAWLTLGTTPLHAVQVPRGYLRWKISKQGVGEEIVAPTNRAVMRFALDSAQMAPAGMVRVGAQRWGDMIAFMGWVGPYQMPEFFMDRFEVTNREYQAFVDSGGYRNPSYWTEPFVDHGRTLTFADAMDRFRDRTGRAGPSTWEGGHFPEGQGDYPVSGVSWYEAAAYAVFAHKSLPSVAQWYEAAPPAAGRYVTQVSNISHATLAPVGKYRGVGPYGTYDMAGNVREWALNALDPDRRFILGGTWRAPSYLYAEPESLSPFDRSPGNGIRCVRNVQPLPAEAARPVKPIERDFSKATPASDAVFRAYELMYQYDHTPLNAKVDSAVVETKDWRRERVTFDAAYNGERMSAYLYLPKGVKPPYQTVLFFPSARVLDLTDTRTLGDTSFFDFVVQSGRAVMYPIYEDTYDRRLRGSMPGTLEAIPELVPRARDVMRSLDYLATRSDIDTGKVAYLGVSMGAAEGVIYATLAQDRLKTVIFLDGGYFLMTPPPGGDQADFAPRLRKPVLMVNGRYDFSFPLDRAQEPLFRMLGTPAGDKRHVVLETPHDVRNDRPALIREVLGWLDKYLGRVQ